MKTIKIREINGTKEWYWNDKLHREDGPAIEYVDGSKEWWVNGKLHREDGPAREWDDGTKEWWLNDKHVYDLGPIGNYILVEDGLPSNVKWLNKTITQRKVLTEKGIMYIPNLPGI